MLYSIEIARYIMLIDMLQGTQFSILIVNDYEITYECIIVWIIDLKRQYHQFQIVTSTMSAKARLQKYRHQLKQLAIWKYQQTIREELTRSLTQRSQHEQMDIETITSDSSNNVPEIKSFSKLLDCETNHKTMSQMEYLACSSAEIKALAQKFQTQFENKQFSGESIEEFCKLVYFVSYSVESGKLKFLKLKCIQIMYLILPNLLESVIDLSTNLILPATTSMLRLISLINLLIGNLSVKFKDQESDAIDIQLLSFLVLQKVYFMKETRLLTHNKTIGNTYYLLQHSFDLVFSEKVGAKQIILNNTLQTIKLVLDVVSLWGSQKFQDMFQCFVQHLFELFQNQPTQHIRTQNLILLLQIIYEKSDLLFSYWYEQSKTIFSDLILKAIELQVKLSGNANQLTPYLVLKLMIEYGCHTNIIEPRWMWYCFKVVERGFNEEKAGLQQCMALILLYEVEEGQRELELLQHQMQHRQFGQLFEHLMYYNQTEQMSKVEIYNRIYVKLVGSH